MSLYNVLCAITHGNLYFEALGNHADYGSCEVTKRNRSQKYLCFALGVRRDRESVGENLERERLWERYLDG